MRLLIVDLHRCDTFSDATEWLFPDLTATAQVFFVRNLTRVGAVYAFFLVLKRIYMSATTRLATGSVNGILSIVCQGIDSLFLLLVRPFNDAQVSAIEAVSGITSLVAYMSLGLTAVMGPGMYLGDITVLCFASFGVIASAAASVVETVALVSSILISGTTSCFAPPIDGAGLQPMGDTEKMQGAVEVVAEEGEGDDDDQDDEDFDADEKMLIASAVGLTTAVGRGISDLSQPSVDAEKMQGSDEVVAELEGGDEDDEKRDGNDKIVAASAVGLATGAVASAAGQGISDLKPDRDNGRKSSSDGPSSPKLDHDCMRPSALQQIMPEEKFEHDSVLPKTSSSHWHHESNGFEALVAACGCGVSDHHGGALGEDSHHEITMTIVTPSRSRGAKSLNTPYAAWIRASPQAHMPAPMEPHASTTPRSEWRSLQNISPPIMKRGTTLQTKPSSPTPLSSDISLDFPASPYIPIIFEEEQSSTNIRDSASLVFYNDSRVASGPAAAEEKRVRHKIIPVTLSNTPLERDPHPHPHPHPQPHPHRHTSHPHQHTMLKPTHAAEGKHVRRKIIPVTLSNTPHLAPSPTRLEKERARESETVSESERASERV